MNSLKKAAVKAVVNAPGKRLSKKWVIIESDDWGSIRTSSKASLERLKKKGYPVEECPFTSNDALESNKDLEVLFDALSSIKGSDGKPAKITFDTVLTNPDFNKIKTNGFQRMEVEHFYETTKRINGSENIQALYHEGMSSGVMKPQFHGLHHVHSNNWLSALRKGEKSVLDAFHEGMFTVHQHGKTTCKDFYLDAWAMHNSDDERVISQELQEGLNLFEKTFGFKSTSAIPPCFAITDKGLEVLSKSEVKQLQAPLYKHNVANPSKKERLFTGKRNPQGMFYTVRNVNFEPSLFPNKDWVSEVLKDVYWAFFWGKPAIINSHRLNFIGSLNESNRTKNIQLLTVILKEIIKRWPEVEFVSSDRLAEFYN